MSRWARDPPGDERRHSEHLAGFSEWLHVLLRGQADFAGVEELHHEPEVGGREVTHQQHRLLVRGLGVQEELAKERRVGGLREKRGEKS